MRGPVGINSVLVLFVGQGSCLHRVAIGDAAAHYLLSAYGPAPAVVAGFLTGDASQIVAHLLQLLHLSVPKWADFSHSPMPLLWLASPSEKEARCTNSSKVARAVSS